MLTISNTVCMWTTHHVRWQCGTVPISHSRPDCELPPTGWLQLLNEASFRECCPYHARWSLATTLAMHVSETWLTR